MCFTWMYDNITEKVLQSQLISFFEQKQLLDILQEWCIDV